MTLLRLVALLPLVVGTSGACQPGQREAGPGLCTNCAAGQYSVSGRAVKCQACAASFWTEDRDGQTACWAMPTPAPTPSPTPLPCIPGSFLRDQERDLCAPCAAGHFSALYGATACSACDVNTHAPSAGATVCVPCGNNMWTAGARGATACSAAPTTTPAPTPCGAGSHVRDPQRPGMCALCDFGRFSAGPGALSCTPCAVNTFAASQGASKCDDCPSGRYTASLEAQVSCITMPTPAPTLEPTTPPTPAPTPECAAGKYRFGPNQCEECPTGQFSSATNVDTCKECPADFFASRRGTKQCSPCVAGAWTSTARGQSACIARPTPAPVTQPPTPPPTPLPPTPPPTPAPTPAPTPGPVNCIMSVWSGWTPCSQECLQTTAAPYAVNPKVRRLGGIPVAAADRGGFRWRVRNVLVRAEHGGTPCPSRMEDQPCNRHACGAGTSSGDTTTPTCGTPPAVDHAGVAYQSLETGSKAIYTCGAGYKLNGYNQIECFCASDGACQWTSVPRCEARPQPPPEATPAPTPNIVVGGAVCECDPSVHVATDVSCSLERHTCHTKGDECNGQIHNSLRVYHIHNARMHAHHRCKVLPGGQCRCCDCDQTTAAADGCPCGAAHHFFSKRWQFGFSPYWWTFRPKPGTKTCEVRGEMARMGRFVTPGDVFFSGRLTTKLEELRGGVQHKEAMLHLDGVWTEPADTKCPHLHADADVFHKLELAAPAHPYHCGAMSFDVKQSSGYSKLGGSWYYTAAQPMPWQISWSQCSVKPSNMTAAAPTVHCSDEHKNELEGLSTGAVCT